MDLLELICLLQTGKITKDFDLGKYKVRNRLQVGKDEFATIRFCKHCYADCLDKFTGQLIQFDVGEFTAIVWREAK